MRASKIAPGQDDSFGQLRAEQNHEMPLLPSAEISSLLCLATAFRVSAILLIVLLLRSMSCLYVD